MWRHRGLDSWEDSQQTNKCTRVRTLPENRWTNIASLGYQTLHWYPRLASYHLASCHHGGAGPSHDRSPLPRVRLCYLSQNNKLSS